MLGKITATDNLPRWYNTVRKTSTPLQSKCRTNENKTKKLSSGKCTSSTALKAHEDLGQPNNDDTLDKENEIDWRSFRAKMVSSEKHEIADGNLGTDWAHEIAIPEKGCLLLAKKPNLGMFNQSAVLLLQHNDQTSTLGLVLNAPSPSKLENTYIRGWKAGRFARERIYFGGPLEMNSLHILHSHGELEKCSKIVDGVYIGGFEDAQEKVEAGIISPSDFKLVVGFSSWGPYQLARELQDDVWFVVSASKKILLQKDDDLGGVTDRFRETYWENVINLSGLEVPF